jgi:hypothetical protein
MKFTPVLLLLSQLSIQLVRADEAVIVPSQLRNNVVGPRQRLAKRKDWDQEPTPARTGTRRVVIPRIPSRTQAASSVLTPAVGPAAFPSYDDEWIDYQHDYEHDYANDQAPGDYENDVHPYDAMTDDEQLPSHESQMEARRAATAEGGTARRVLNFDK